MRVQSSARDLISSLIESELLENRTRTHSTLLSVFPRRGARRLSTKERNIKETVYVLTCNFMARKLVDSFEGGVLLKRARGHQNNFIGGHVKGAIRRRGCDSARATSMLHLVDRPADIMLQRLVGNSFRR